MATVAEVFANLTEVQVALRALLAGLDHGALAGDSWKALVDRVQRASAALGEPGELVERVPADQQGRLQAELKSWLHLVALVAKVVGDESKDAGTRLAAAQLSRRNLRALRPLGGAGGTLNVTA